MSVLVDSSVWIDYFRGGKRSSHLDDLIESNALCVNDLILAELIPFLKVRKQSRVIKLLQTVQKTSLRTDWDAVTRYQTVCLEKGINGIGIPDLLIVDDTVRNGLVLFTLDKHFHLIRKHIRFEIRE